MQAKNIGKNKKKITTFSREDSVGLYTLKNSNGLVAQFTNYGARLMSLWVPDHNGFMSDIVLGYASLEEYTKEKNYFGATCGRFANRIAKGLFTLNDVDYQLATNNGDNHLHGGVKGFESVAWKVDEFTGQKLVLSYSSNHMEEGYPGNLSVTVTYQLTDDNELSISYYASTDRATIVNFTHHSFFNLKGEGESDILNHFLRINATEFTPLKKGSIPTGEILPVANTPFDFQQSRQVGEQIDRPDRQLQIGNGYDHNFVLNGEMGKLREVAELYEPVSKRKMTVLTTEPGMQVYTANYLDGSITGKSGKQYQRKGAICLETQHFPDSPNQSHFPSVVLQPNHVFESKTVYRFSIQEE